jgi:3-oxoacyl-[acyl-carrier-protein] synthase III
VNGKDTETRIVEVVREENEATRRHISSVVGDIRNDTRITKTRMQQVKQMVRRFLTKMGVTTDDIDP